MKRNLLFLLLCFLLMEAKLEAQSKAGYEIKVKIKGYTEPKLLIGNYYGDKEYVKDSAVMNSKGWYVFKHSEPLPCGIYSVINGERTAKLFEFMVNDKEQNFSIETDTLNYTVNAKVSGSIENQKFFEYLKSLDTYGSRRFELQKQLDTKKDNPDEVKKIKDEIYEIDKAAEQLRKVYIENNPGLMSTKIFRAMTEIQVPEPPKNNDGTTDSLFQYIYYKTHFWDNFDFTDDCLVRTPLYARRLDTYIQKLTLQIPDSIKVAADRIIEKVAHLPEVYKYTVFWITYTYERSKFMCMDAVPIHMWKNYYGFTKSPWVDSTTIIRMKERVKATEPLICGAKAPNLIMRDATQKTHILHQVDAKYTVLVFWDPDCSHCKKEMPIIRDAYKKLASHGVKVFAVGVEQEYDKWESFIKEHELNWINVIDIENFSNFRGIYDISSTPVIYLLDKNKIILAKKMGADQLIDILMRELGLKDRNAPFAE